MNKIPTCINHYEAIYVCLDSKCRKSNPFICEQNCSQKKCKIIHERCIIKKWKTFQQEIEQGKNKKLQQFNQVYCCIQETISTFIKSLEKQLESFKKWKQNFGMSTNTLQLLQNIQDNKQSNWTGKKLSQLLKQIQINTDQTKFNLMKFNLDKKVISRRIEEIQKLIRSLYLKSEEDQDQLVKSAVNLRSSINLHVQSPIKKMNKNNQIKIKQYYLDKLIVKLSSFKQTPSHLELKWKTTDQRICKLIKHIQTLKMYRSRMIKQLATVLKNDSFKKLITLTIFHPWNLGYNSYRIQSEKLFSESLMNLPQFHLLTIITHGIESMDGFKKLYGKIKIIKDQEWYDKQIW